MENEENEESEENGESAAGKETGTGTESAGGPDPESAADALVPEREIEKGTELLQEEMRQLLQTGVGSERGIMAEMTAGVGRGVENGRGGAGAEIVRETGKEGRVWMEKMWGKERGPPMEGSACWRNMKEKWERGWRSAETGTGTGIVTAGAATGTETDAGETGRETGSTKGREGTERRESAERTDTCVTKWAPRTRWAQRMRRGEHLLTWRSTARMG